VQPTDLAFAGVTRQAELIRSGELSSRELVELYLDRIFRLDQTLNAFRIVFAERALVEAQQADARRGAGEDRPLLGVPIAIKDDMDVRGEVTTKGSIAHGPPAGEDEEFVARLRSAGAVIIGKTNVPEMMIHGFTETPWYGVTRNPWSLDHTPGGSSGGSAAAVAAGLAGAATATDGAGSIRIPAACCHLVGLKPQRDSTPVRTPNWHGLSVNGFITRTVADTVLLQDVVADRATPLRDALADPPAKLRVAVSRSVPKPVMAKVGAEQLQALQRTADAIRDLGHEVVDRDLDFGLMGPRMVSRYLAGIRESALGMADPKRLSRRTKGFSLLGLGPSAAVGRILASEEGDRERLVRSFGNADVVLTPVFTRELLRIGELEGAGAARTLNHEINQVPFPGMFNHTGQPAITIPAGRSAGDVPLSVQMVGRPEGDGTLVALAAQLEQALGWPDARPAMAA
jgi:amidase